ncbi:hypothetical protein ABLE91_17065 [Aquabacter sp. CN5-332]|uniref:hypothetical protein n=1 Tax=Aquabacter sp. CN5-332 TaxID=3156608 RepID=UPI0032B33688
MTAPDIWIQTTTGRALDLMAPTADMVDIVTDLPEALARLPRFIGHVQSGAYSVAQHQCHGSEAIMAETGNQLLAQAFHLHDAHEYAIGDIGTPVAQGLEARVGAKFAALPGIGGPTWERVGRKLFRDALAEQKRDLDIAIYERVGLPWPLPPEILAQVRVWDLRMLAAERAHLLAKPPYPWAAEVEAAAPIRMKGRITVWPWPKAADEWRRRLHLLFPHLPARRAA